MHLKGRKDPATGKIVAGQVSRLTPEAWVKGLLAIHPEYAGIKVAVETGTFRGDGVLFFSPFFREFYTVEIVPAMQAFAKSRCAGKPAVAHAKFMLGDSAKLVPQLAATIKEPVFWMLDAHYCPWVRDGEPSTVMGKFPLWAELAAIAARPYAEIVLVDDFAIFGKRVARNRKPGETGPEWEAVTLGSVAAALGRVMDAREWQNSGVFWRKARGGADAGS